VFFRRLVEPEAEIVLAALAAAAKFSCTSSTLRVPMIVVPKPAPRPRACRQRECRRLVTWSLSGMGRVVAWTPPVSSSSIRLNAPSERRERGMGVPEVLSPAAMPADAPSPQEVEIVTPRPSSGAATPVRVSVPRRSAPEAWADWRATGSAASAKVFCESVSSWIEGASAQLGRPAWPTGGVRPTSIEVQARLRQGLGLVVTQEADYIKALEAARRHVEQKLSKERARDIAAG
jgi:hypothetical protein